MALEPPRRAFDLVEPVDLDVELDVLAQLLDIEAVPLEGRDRFVRKRPGPGRQTGA